MVMKVVVLMVAVGLAGCASSSEKSRGVPAPSERDPNVATEKDWRGQVVSQPEELFAGRFAGVQVFRLPDGIAVRIRGSNSLSADQEPLYVIDGQTIQAGPGGALMGVNPADIESIEVLKDIGATAQYGVRGANGVILIRTKQGR
jgi:TonB-dependent SusC/RagA subfamily outer membrane receptor